MEYLVDIWKPKPRGAYQHLDFRKNYEHFLNVKVIAKNEEQGIEKAIIAAYGQLSKKDKIDICKADLMCYEIKKII